MIRIKTEIRSPNFETTEIPIEFAMLHYTAGDLQRAASIFRDESRGVSCHLLISGDGDVYEVVDCLSNSPRQAAHAGKSFFEEDGQQWTAFNRFSLGIELENLNGNLFDFSDAQYGALREVFGQLKERFPALRNPNRVLGHEHVASWRGKADPGWCFSWDRFYRENYPGLTAPRREPTCPGSYRSTVAKFVGLEPRDRTEAVKFWHAVSAVTEAGVALANKSKTPAHYADSP